MDHPTSPPKMPVTIAPPPGAMVCYGVAADAHLHTPMKKSRSDERLSGVDLQEARAQFHQMLSRERPDLNNRDKGRIVRSTINHKTADNLDAAIQQKMANLEGERQVMDLGEGGSKNEKMKETVIPPTTKDPPALGPSPFSLSRNPHLL